MRSRSSRFTPSDWIKARALRPNAAVNGITCGQARPREAINYHSIRACLYAATHAAVCGIRQTGLARQAFGRDLADARGWCQKYERGRREADLNQAWDLYYQVGPSRL